VLPLTFFFAFFSQNSFFLTQPHHFFTQFTTIYTTFTNKSLKHLDNISETNKNYMTYSKLQSILPNDEIHYMSDSTQFFIDNQIKSKQFKNNEFILFEYTIECFPETIKSLNKNNIKYSIHTDSFDLDYILI
jgi:hypothetical protein